MGQLTISGVTSYSLPVPVLSSLLVHTLLLLLAAALYEPCHQPTAAQLRPSNPATFTLATQQEEAE